MCHYPYLHEMVFIFWALFFSDSIVISTLLSILQEQTQFSSDPQFSDQQKNPWENTAFPKATITH